MADAFFKQMQDGVAKDGPALVKKTKAVFQFNLKDKGESGLWVVDLKNGDGKVFQGKAQKADATMTLSEKDFLSMAEGKLAGPQAFMQGKLKITGNMMLAQKLGGVLDGARGK